MNTIESRLRDSLAYEARNLPPEDEARLVMADQPARRRHPLIVFSVTATLVLVAAVPLLLRSGSGRTPSPAAGVTEESILNDGKVTPAEYWAAADAVAACVMDAGFEIHVLPEHLGASLPERHAEFQYGFDGNSREAAQEAFDECQSRYLSYNVMLGWSAVLGQLDLGQTKDTDEAIFACVEDRTGEDFGALEYDGFGFLTGRGLEARESAFEYGNHDSWTQCEDELGFMPGLSDDTALSDETVSAQEYEQATRTIVDCIAAAGFEVFGPAWDDSHRWYSYSYAAPPGTDMTEADTCLDGPGSTTVRQWGQTIKEEIRNDDQAWESFAACLSELTDTPIAYEGRDKQQDLIDLWISFGPPADCLLPTTPAPYQP